MYEAKSWELQLLLRGYHRRSRPLWESGRLFTFFKIAQWAGKDSDLTPEKLLPLPWDHITQHEKPLTEDEANELIDLINKENERHQ